MFTKISRRKVAFCAIVALQLACVVSEILPRALGMM